MRSIVADARMAIDVAPKNATDKAIKSFRPRVRGRWAFDDLDRVMG
jgi:hypothetical protein